MPAFLAGGRTAYVAFGVPPSTFASVCLLDWGDLATGLEIRANRGVITLRGEVDELTDITRFETAVREAGDIVDVDNLLRLRMRDQRPRLLSA